MLGALQSAFQELAFLPKGGDALMGVSTRVGVTKVESFQDSRSEVNLPGVLGAPNSQVVCR